MDTSEFPRFTVQSAYQPLMILNVWPTGAVTGAVMRSNTSMDLTGLIATTYSKPHEVIGFISEICSMTPGDITHGLRKDTAVSIHSVQAAIKQEYVRSQRAFDVMMYYKGDWYIASPFSRELENKNCIPSFTKIRNLYDISTKHVAQGINDELFIAIAGQTTFGDVKRLEQSLGFADGVSIDDSRYMRDPHYHPSIKYLCEWWNLHAPAPYKNAGAFYLYQWSPQERKFMSCIRGVENLTPHQLSNIGSYALFHGKNGVIFAVIFLCVKEALLASEGVVTVLLANGVRGFEYNTVENLRGVARANEARKSIEGLINILTFGTFEAKKFG